MGIRREEEQKKGGGSPDYNGEILPRRHAWLSASTLLRREDALSPWPAWWA